MPTQLQFSYTNAEHVMLQCGCCIATFLLAILMRPKRCLSLLASCSRQLEKTVFALKFNSYSFGLVQSYLGSHLKDEHTVHVLQGMNPSHMRFGDTAKGEFNMEVTGNTKTDKKLFLYMAMVASCVPAAYLSHAFVDNSATRDLLVLSYKKNCKHDLGHSHVMAYMDGIGSSFTEGRNLLFNEVKRNYGNYLYYTFIDADVHLGYTNQKFLTKEAAGTVSNTLSPLENYERFLLSHTPAVSRPIRVAETTNPNCATDKKNFMIGSLMSLKRCCPQSGVQYNITLVKAHMDADFITYHHDALYDIFPLETKYESKSWWISQQFAMVITTLKYYRQVFYYTGIASCNNGHSSYPQGIKPWQEVLHESLQYIPAKYVNPTFIETFRHILMVIDATKNWGLIDCMQPPCYINESLVLSKSEAIINEAVAPFKHYITKH